MSLHESWLLSGGVGIVVSAAAVVIIAAGASGATGAVEASVVVA